MNTNLPRPTFEQVIRPALAFIFIVIFWATVPHNVAQSDPYYSGPITVRTYDFPQAEKDAVNECYRTEREARGIPGERNAYIEWWNTNKGTEAQLDWSAAFRQCKADNLWKSGKWNWSNMLLVKEEVHYG